MGAYYYLVCEPHKVHVFLCKLSNNTNGLPADIRLFVREHHGCKVRIVNDEVEPEVIIDGMDIQGLT